MLYFEQNLIILRKKNFSKIKELKGSYSNVIEAGNSLIFYTKGGNKVTRFCFDNNNIQRYRYPDGYYINNLAVCPNKKFIISVNSNTENKSKSSIIFWIWDDSEYLYCMDSQKKLERVIIFDDKRLLFTYKTGIIMFDNLKIQFKKRIQFDYELENIYVRNTSQILLKFKTKGFFILDLNTKEKQKISKLAKKVHQVYMPFTKILWEVTDINNVSKIEI